MSQSFEQLFGYSPIEEFQNLGAWQTNRRGAIAPLVDAQVGFYAQQETNRANAELAKQQNDFNVEMWNKQNEYNSPQATMQRLVDAGINPRAYQQIGQFANASQPHQAERPDYDSPMSKLAKFSEQAQIEMAYKKLNLERINLATQTLDAHRGKIIARDKLNEQIRHNKQLEYDTAERDAETYRHNYVMEGIAQSQNQTALKRLHYEMRLQGFSMEQKDDGSFILKTPNGWDNYLASERAARVANLLESVEKSKTEREYLYNTGQLKISQMEFEKEMRTYTYWIDHLKSIFSFGFTKKF